MVHSFKKSLGFTLIELVTVILILSIVLVGVSSFVTFGTRIFVDSSRVDQVLGASRFVIQRMTRELRSALPNSVRLSTDNASYQCIEFVPIVTSTSYIDIPLTSPAPTATVFRDDAPSKITLFQRAFVYPISTDEVYKPNSQNSIGANVIGTRTTSKPAELIVNFFGAARFKYSSPQKRMYFTRSPVTYCVTGVSGAPLSIWRFDRYSFTPNLPTPQNRGTGSVIAQDITNKLVNVSDLPFGLLQSTLRHSAIVQFNLRFEVLGQSMSYQHQVQVPNVP